VYPVLSGFVITFLIQKEYADVTMINTLTAPVTRIKFLLGKLIVWALWHIAITLCFLTISCVGVYSLYGYSILAENFSAILATVLKGGIFFLGTLLPVAWVAVLQRKAFYPALLLTLFITALGITGLLQPGLLGSLIPWAAVYLLVMPGAEVISGVAYTSIIVCAVVGFGLAAHAIKKQEL
jgi:bacitracin transport system permease protein